MAQEPIILTFESTGAQALDPVAGTVTIARFNGERDQVDLIPGSDLPPLEPGDKYSSFSFPTQIDPGTTIVSIGK